MDMKLNKYIYEKLNEVANIEDWSDITDEEIEDWIVDWYMDTFQEVGCDGDKSKARAPPMWLAGPRWYDRRARKIKEAQIEEATRSSEKDEV